MIRLTREVRFFAGAEKNSDSEAVRNGWAGSRGIARLPFWVVRVQVEGKPDRQTGYVCDIKLLDNLVLEHIESVLSGNGSRDDASFDQAVAVAAKAVDEVGRRLPRHLRLNWIQVRFSPFTWMTLEGDPAMTRLTQSYEFSASHRLQCPGLSDAENLELFGKCSNPHGHGHNYLLEITVDGSQGPAVVLAELDRVVGETVIEPLDHKNLNIECPEFATLNPTVENIAQVIFDRLIGRLGQGRLVSVRVWETAKTYAECDRASPV